ncbi:MAG: DUF86 domain-containing protein [Pleurocapsa minor HA4230-MV1]|jgi:uncharacterized protein with HEPN domain|nr:DUF86 domain-containing protein [Pleurocapsa minor HA4230-MV1]
MKNDLLYLSNIQECIEAIESYTDAGEETFMRTRIIQDAVIRNFEVIGEATKRLSPKIKEKYPEIPWRRIAGLRDVLIHDYLRVDLAEVWGIISDYLPELKIKIRMIIQDIED